MEKIMTYFEFNAVFPYMTEYSKAMSLEKLNNAEKPEYFLGEETIENLNLITFGDYSDLCDAIGNEDQEKAIFDIVHVLYPKASKEKIENENVYDVWGFATWVVKEVGKINNLFGSIKVDYTEQEKKAGISALQFGTFGILDWYARRMGIADQNLVNNEKWVRIFQCMKNDAEETAYNRRLQKIYEQDAKRHK